MGSQVLCINNIFNEEALKLYAKYGVKIPEKDKIYTIRSKQKHSNGEWGIKLVEINNPEIPIGFYVDLKTEVTWNLKRFVDLFGNLLDEKELIKTYLELKEVKENEFYKL